MNSTGPGGEQRAGSAFDGLGLDGLAVAVTGRLASMTRDEAVARVAAAGGRYVETPTATTDLLVYGLGGPPLDAEGRPTAKLVRARELVAAGAALAIVPEDEWLGRLADEERRAELHRLYTTEQLGRILGVDRARVRAWVRHGLVRPARVVRRLCWFGYQEVVHARAVVELTASGVGAGRLEDSLRQLESWCGEDGRPLLRLGVRVEDGVVTARLPDGSVVEPSGQLRLRFEEQPDAGPTADGVREPTGGSVRSGPRPAAMHAAFPEVARTAFERGVRAEEEARYADAIEAYRACEAAGGAEAEVPFNLGNALYALERFDEAAVALERAVRLDAEYVEAWNNLGSALLDGGRVEEAERAFRHALALVPDYADAHYNLAGALLLRDDFEGARRHWSAYLEQDPQSSSADAVRLQLAQLDAALSRP